MIHPKNQPDDWWTVKKTPLIEAYEGFFEELCAPVLESGFPYTNCRWKDRFAKAPGKALWKVKRSGLGDSLSLDLIAVAERNFPTGTGESEAGAFGGAGANGGTIWIPVLDGGVLIDFTLVEDQWTNRLSAYQETIVGGSHCFRFLLAELGFQPIKRRIADEKSIPSFDQIRLLRAAQLDPTTEEHKSFMAAVDRPAPEWGRDF